MISSLEQFLWCSNPLRPCRNQPNQMSSIGQECLPFPQQTLQNFENSMPMLWVRVLI